LSASVRDSRPFVFVEEYLFGFIHWPFRVFKAKTRPRLTDKTINNPI
jgi:hypothetical protein